ncbi:MAG: Gfo/Idh/MocA family oxidoreductase [Anaerolineae bacterium]|nr:Gfo/Idh/MocA family oxidoreductase [Anaerolineae bacterium]
MANQPVRWGVLGCAMIAINRVIPGMQTANLTTLTAVASRSLEKAQDVAARFAVPKAYGTYEELLADPDIEAVYIPLPNGLHAEWSIKALRAGKHVLCEKPLAMDAAEARAFQAVRDEMGLYCLEAFAYRFNPTVAKAFEIAQSGVLGELRFMHTVSTFLMDTLDPANVRLRADIGGGALYDMGCYAVNAQRMLAGREPRTAWATMAWSERFDVDMAGTAMLDFGEGLLGTVQWGFNAPYGGPFSVVGEKGRLTGTYGWHAPAGEPAMLLIVGSETQPVYVEHANDYTGEVQDLSEAVRGLHEPLYAWEPLDANMRVIDACYASQKSGKAESV